MLPDSLKKYEKQQPVLDKGFVRLIDIMGDDSSIVQAARVSYGEGTKSVSDDRSLTRYLMRHHHMTPFEMCEIKLHVKAPIFVIRQWLRHRTFSVNEVSRRYSTVPEDYYVPDLSRVGEQSKDNKQGTGKAFDESVASTLSSVIDDSCKNSMSVYNSLTEESLDRLGMSREVARTVTPVGSYTELYLKVDLRNLFNFLKLRMDSHAQYEIRVFADKIAEITKEWVPVAYEAFEDYILNSESFSRQEMDTILRLASIASNSTSCDLDKMLKESGVSSKREREEFISKFKRRGLIC